MCKSSPPTLSSQTMKTRGLPLGYTDNVSKIQETEGEKKKARVLVKREKYPSHVEERCTEVGHRVIFPELIVQSCYVQ